jgi:hypothetical protein
VARRFYPGFTVDSHFDEYSWVHSSADRLLYPTTDHNLDSFPQSITDSDPDSSHYTLTAAISGIR